MPNVSSFAVVVSSLSLAACAQRVYTPPTQFLPLESAAIAAPGDVIVHAEGGHAGELFGPNIVTGNARLRLGVAENLEVAVSGSALRVATDAPSKANRGLYAGRVGLKSQFAPWVAFVGGVGAGYAPAGGAYAGVDGAFVASYENCILVPFVSAGGYGSAPIRARAIDVTDADNTGLVTDTPSKTFGLGLGAGVKLRLTGCRREHAVSLLAGWQGTHVWDYQTTTGFFGMSGGLEISL